MPRRSAVAPVLANCSPPDPPASLNILVAELSHGVAVCMKPFRKVLHIPGCVLLVEQRSAARATSRFQQDRSIQFPSRSSGCQTVPGPANPFRGGFRLEGFYATGTGTKSLGIFPTKHATGNHRFINPVSTRCKTKLSTKIPDKNENPCLCRRSIDGQTSHTAREPSHAAR